MHHAALGPLRQLVHAVLADRAAAHEDRVAAAAVGGQQVWVARRDRAPCVEAGVAARERHSGARAGRRRQPRRPPRRHLLEQRHVPGPGRQRLAELRGQRAAGRGHGAAVEEVPGQDEDGREAIPGSPTLARLPRHFLTGSELSADELAALLDRALALKAAPYSSRALEDRSVALVFEQPSTRTRTSFEAGIVEL